MTKQYMSCSLRSKRLLGLIFLAVLWLLTAAVADPVMASAKSLRNMDVGDKLPAITLSPLSGGGAPVTFTPGSGKPSAVLYLTASSDFQKEKAFVALKDLAAVVGEFGAKIDSIVINGDSEGVSAILDFLKEQNISLTVVDDQKRDVYNQYGIFMMPVTILTSKEGKIMAVVPATENSRELIAGNLKVALGEMSAEDLEKSINPDKEEGKSPEESKYNKKINYAKVMVERKMYPQAEREFTEAIALQPEKVEAYIELGFVQLAQKEFAKAETTFNDVLKRDENSVDSVAGLGLALYGKGDIENALPELEDAVMVKQPKLEILIALAEIYEQKGNLKGALEKYKSAVVRLQSMIAHEWKQ